LCSPEDNHPPIINDVLVSIQLAIFDAQPLRHIQPVSSEKPEPLRAIAQKALSTILGG